VQGRTGSEQDRRRASGFAPHTYENDDGWRAAVVASPGPQRDVGHGTAAPAGAGWLAAGAAPAYQPDGPGSEAGAAPAYEYDAQAGGRGHAYVNVGPAAASHCYAEVAPEGMPPAGVVSLPPRAPEGMPSFGDEGRGSGQRASGYSQLTLPHALYVAVPTVRASGA